VTKVNILLDSAMGLEVNTVHPTKLDLCRLHDVGASSSIWWDYITAIFREEWFVVLCVFILIDHDVRIYRGVAYYTCKWCVCIYHC